MNGFLDKDWTVATQDAGLDPSELRLYRFAGNASPRNQKAAYVSPGDVVIPGSSWPVGSESDDDLARHRVGVWTDADPTIRLAALRHELEHARQYEAHGRAIFSLTNLIKEVIGLRTVVGWGVLVQTLPIEADAHAAAATLALARYPGEVERLLSEKHEDSVILRSVSGPEPVETLPMRTVCFAYQYATLSERWAKEYRGMPFEDLVDSVWAGAGAVWRRLHADAL
jgi:hypothetical protein